MRQVREVPEQVALNQLHECDGVRGNVIAAGGVQSGIAAAGHVNHRRYVQFHHLLVERIPETVRQGRMFEMAAAGIRVQVAAHKTHVDTALQFLDRSLHIGGRRLRQHADRYEYLRIQDGATPDQVVVHPRPLSGDVFIADMRRHRGCARRKNRHVRTALA